MATGRLDSGTALVRISCTSAFCALADSDGNILTATNPGGGLGEWSSAAVTGEYIDSLDCPSVGLCVAQVGGASAGIYYATNPTGGVGAWTRSMPPHGELKEVTGVACASTTLCVGGLFDSLVSTTTPTTETASWATTSLPAAHGLGHISCSSSTFCAALENDGVNNTGNIWTSTDPSQEGATWSRAEVDTAGTLNAISCAPGTTLCVAVDDFGDVFTSTEPAGGASKWTKTALSGVDFPSSISCPTSSFCAMVDQAGHVITSTSPTTGSWSVSSPLTGNPVLASISCPSGAFCAASELSGAHVFTSAHPTGGPSEWTSTELEGASYVNGIACASASLCVTGGSSEEYVTKEPFGGTTKWTKEALGWITGVSCPSESLCVASGMFGGLSTSANPTEGAGTWSGTDVTFYENGLNSVSCPSTSFCAAADSVGDVITGQPTGPAGAVPTITTPPTLSGEAIVGKTLTEEHGAWTGGPILSYSYEWQRCAGVVSCTSIPGAEGQSLVLTTEDEGFQIRVLERARNAEGTSAPSESALTAGVSPAGGTGPGGGGTTKEEPKVGSGSTSGGTTGTTGTGTAGGGTSGSGAGGGAVATISSSQITGALGQVLGAPAKAAVTKLLKQGILLLPFKAPEAGSLLLQWYELPHGAKLAKAKAKPVLVASGQVVFSAAGTVTVHLKLTPTGKRLLKNTSGLKVTARASFTPTGKTAISTTRTFVLKH